MEVHLPGMSSQTSHSPASSVPPVEFLDELGVSSTGELNFSFGAQEENKVSLAAIGGRLTPSDVEDTAGLPALGVPAQSESDTELVAVLAQATASIGLEYVPPPSAKRSRLDDCFLRSGGTGQVPSPWFPSSRKCMGSSHGMCCFWLLHKLPGPAKGQNRAVPSSTTLMTG